MADFYVRMTIGLPAFFDITPRTAHITTAEANKKCGFSGVMAFALYRIKCFHNRQCMHSLWYSYFRGFLHAAQRYVNMEWMWGVKKPHEREFGKTHET